MRGFRTPTLTLPAEYALCPTCGGTLDDFGEPCPACAEREASRSPVEKLTLQLAKLNAYFERYSQTPVPGPIPMPEAVPLEAGEVQQYPGKKRREITPVDKLAPGNADVLKVQTKATVQAVQLCGRDANRRSVSVVNLGQPTLGNQGVVTAANAWIDFGESVNATGDAFWLQPGADITLDYTGPIWAVDDGTNSTVLYVVMLRV